MPTQPLLLFALLLLLLISFLGCGRLYTARVEARYPGEGRFVELKKLSFTDSLRVHVSVEGEGEPLLYIHGNYGSLLDVTRSPIYQALLSEYRVFAYDRPGSGHSERGTEGALTLTEHAEVALALMDHFQINSSHLLAHSFGGAVAMRLALDVPERLQGLLLLAPAVYPWPGDKVFFKDRLVQIPVFGTFFLETFFVPLAYMRSRAGYEEVFDSEHIPDEYFYPSRALAIRPETFLATAKDTSILWDTLARQSKRYSEISLETRIVSGDKDRSVSPLVHARPLSGVLENASLKILPTASHNPQFTHPEQVLSFFGLTTGKAQK